MAESGDRQAWSKIDKVERGGYPYLEADDLCYYYLERSHGTWEKGMANSTVSNFQKDIEHYSDRPDVLRYKQKAIEYFADKIGSLFARKQRACPLVIVPMITSKPKNHPLFDNRLLETANLVAANRPGEVVVCDILDIDAALPKSKLGGNRSPHEIEKHLLVSTPTLPQAKLVFLLDDVITTGGHYAACRDAIRSHFPHALIVGVFLARQKFGYEYTVVGFPEG